MKLVISSLDNTKKKFNLYENIANIDRSKNFHGKIKYVDHHRSYSFIFVFYEECANLSIDGFGDFASCAYGKYKNNSLIIDHKIYFPHSLGIFIKH